MNVCLNFCETWCLGYLLNPLKNMKIPHSHCYHHQPHQSQRRHPNPCCLLGCRIHIITNEIISVSDIINKIELTCHNRWTKWMLYHLISFQITNTPSSSVLDLDRYRKTNIYCDLASAPAIPTPPCHPHMCYIAYRTGWG